MLGSLGWQELLIVLAILALVFGASRVADLGGALGKGIREFRTEASGGDKDKDKDDKDKDADKDKAAAAADKPADADKSG